MSKKPSNASFILSFAADRKQFGISELLDFFSINNRQISRAVARAQLNALKKAGKIGNPSHGVYCHADFAGNDPSEHLAQPNKKSKNTSGKRKRHSKWLSFFEETFRSSGQPTLTTNELVEAVRERDPNQKSPSALIHSYATQYPSELIKVGQGVFTWHNLQGSSSPKKGGRSCALDSFGIYWSRDDSGIKKIQLSGEDLEGSAVDISEGQGIYILYKNDRVVYVGRAMKSRNRGLGRRLTEHTRTKSRLKNRWDSFSFFEIGGEHAEEVIELIEGILIEVLVPPENRQAGTGVNPEKEISQIRSKEVRDQLGQKALLDAFLKTFKPT